MRGWSVLPVAIVLVIIVALPLAALTDSGVERDARKALGLNTGECEPMTNEESAWMSGPDLPSELDEPRAVWIGGKVYLVGGVTGLEESESGELLLEPSDQLTSFDPQTGRYERLASLPRPLNHVGVLAYEGHLYVLGGYGRRLDSGTSSAFYRYTPSRNRWSRMPDLPEPRAAMAVGVIGDRLILSGGARDTTPVADTFAFDFRAHRWSQLPDMPSKREHVGHAVLGDRLFVLGGRSTGILADDTAEVYDAGEERWSRLPSMPVETGGLGAVTTDGKVVAVGGGNDVAGTVTGAVQQWDPAAGHWSLLSPMRTPRHGHATVATGDRIWVFGGSPCAYFNSTDSVEWLTAHDSDPRTGPEGSEN